MTWKKMTDGFPSQKLSQYLRSFDVIAGDSLNNTVVAELTLWIPVKREEIFRSFGNFFVVIISQVIQQGL